MANLLSATLMDNSLAAKKTRDGVERPSATANAMFVLITQVSYDTTMKSLSEFNEDQI